MIRLLKAVCPVLISIVRATSSVVSADKISMLNQVYSIRHAKTEDIPYINKCNVENLPENYSYEFFYRHLTLWPELSLVAENNRKELIGYTLGKAELLPPPPKEMPGRNPVELLTQKNSKGFSKPTPRPSYCGHVTSIAVFSEYRLNFNSYQFSNKEHY